MCHARQAYYKLLTMQLTRHSAHTYVCFFQKTILGSQNKRWLCAFKFQNGFCHQTWIFYLYLLLHAMYCMVDGSEPMFDSSSAWGLDSTLWEWPSKFGFKRSANRQNSAWIQNEARSSLGSQARLFLKGKLGFARPIIISNKYIWKWKMVCLFF